MGIISVGEESGDLLWYDTIKQMPSHLHVLSFSISKSGGGGKGRYCTSKSPHGSLIKLSQQMTDL